ncbi:MAG TPA: YceI family protein [Chitinophagaceae bacterium]|nr:YceI family protein [Chitinophagaceae bacterium]
MKKPFLILPVLLIASIIAAGQDKYFTKTGKIFFKCTQTSSIEKIEAVNNSATCVLDTKTGNMQFAVLMKGFEFERALMEEHFNENYVESVKFPRSEFRGQVINNNEINYSKDGSYSIKVKGTLTIHGVTKDVETDGILQVKQGKLFTNAIFNIKLSDYKISIPSVVSDKISNTVNISVDCTLESLNK